MNDLEEKIAAIRDILFKEEFEKGIFDGGIMSDPRYCVEKIIEKLSGVSSLNRGFSEERQDILFNALYEEYMKNIEELDRYRKLINKLNTYDLYHRDYDFEKIYMEDQLKEVGLGND